MTAETDLPDHVLATKGIKSPVMAGPAERLRGIGHVALLDWDDHMNLTDVRRQLDTEPVGGPTVVFESSPGNLHGWQLGIRSFTATARVMRELNDDGKHRTVGESRGWWRLRAGPKVSYDETDPYDPYKPAPEFVEVIDGPGCDGGVSAPHLAVADALAGETLIPDAEDRYDLRGSSVLTATYTTFTDLEKPLQRADSRLSAGDSDGA